MRTFYECWEIFPACFLVELLLFFSREIMLLLLQKVALLTSKTSFDILKVRHNGSYYDSEM